MATEGPPASCSNPECRVAETGKCVEGLPFDQCRYFGGVKAAKDEDEAAPEGRIQESEEKQGPLLPSGERLEIADASAVMRAGDTRVIAIIGPVEAGKTTLIASLYDLFQKGPVGNFQFARSRTFPAFEQACHHARAASKRAVPHSERTPLGSGLGFYHMGLRNPASCELLDLLLADRSGESYRSVADDPSVSAGFAEVVRADSICILVDGHRLVDVGARHNVQNDIQMILQGLVDGDAVHSGQHVAFVLTKLDEVQLSKEQERAQNDFKRMVEAAQRLFGHVLGQIVSLQVAACPATDDLPYGYGVANLLEFWIAPPAAVRHPALPPLTAERAMGRLTEIAE